VWPFRILSNLYRGVGSRRAEARFEKNLVGLSPITERQLVRVSTIPKIAERRELLIKYIWPGRNFPLDRLPDSVVVGITDPSFEAAPEIMRITRLTTRMRDNFRSVAYYFEPGNPSGCLMLYQHGHGENFRSGKPVIMRLLSSGCAVLAFSMPLARGEQLPVIRDSILGDLTIRSHNEFALLEAPDFSPIAYFVEPIAAGLNYVLRAKSFSRVGMMGISGGGWTTVVYAALDERIKRSYPVAGSEPIWLMVRRPEGWLDYEQANVGLYRTAEYAELYVMATSAGRHQLQVLNRFDACCYYGKGYRFYAPTVSRVARDVGGSFRIFLDETHREHKLSSVALDSILVDFLGSEGR
jgi:pimeloyl-ACP methyl ester carboxylesterase